MLRVQFKNVINSFLKPLGAEITRIGSASGIKTQQAHDPSCSFMQEEKLRNMLINELSEIARIFFSERLNGIMRSKLNYTLEVEKFMTLYSSRPLTENTGGSGFHNAFWLWLFVRSLNPNLIVESGVWKGHTTWLLEQACPKAKIVGFDINLSRLEYSGGNAEFYEHDWSEYRFPNVDPERSFVFFDCHVNHAKRIHEARDRGFRHLIFDDNPPAHKLYAYGLPGIPTVNMIWNGLVVQSNTIVWKWQGKEISYQVDPEEMAKARAIMKKHEMFPDVGGITRYGGFSFLTYVQI